MWTVEQARKRLEELRETTTSHTHAPGMIITLSASLEERLLQALDDAELELGRGAADEIPLLWRVEEIADLLAAQQELTELRRVLTGTDDVGLSDEDGDPIDVELDASGLIEEVRRRLAKAMVRCYEDSEGGAPLELLMALPEQKWELGILDRANRYDAAWTGGPFDPMHQAAGATRVEAIRAATLKLLGLDPAAGRQLSDRRERVVQAAMALADELATHDDGTSAEAELMCAVEELRGAPAEPRPKTCRSCVYFERGAAPAASGDGSARPCGARGGLLVHPDSGDCEEYAPDTDPAPSLPGVSRPAGNVVRAKPEGDDDG